MTLGYFAPLPPAPTGVADYAEALLGELRKLGDVAVNEPGDVALYHAGNNRLHASIYRLAIGTPGVVLLHDAVLTHLLLGVLPEAEWIEEFVYNYGEWNRALACDLWRNRAGAAADPRYFRYPMLKRLVRASRAVIVHNPAAAARVRDHHPAAVIHQVNHFFAAPPPPDSEGVRESLAIGPRTFLAGVFGHLRESKRLPSVLRAVQRCRERGGDIALLLAGEIASPDLLRSVQPWLAETWVRRTGFLSEADFWRHAAAVDACVNLRYPGAGETSGIGVRLMGIGKPVIATTGDEVASIPDAALLRVAPGAAEIDELSDLLLWLAGSPAATKRIGDSARDWIASECNIQAAASRIWQIATKSR
ncbi:MAG: hypothetical protein K2X35_02405 [Bryobacteraceae bacterium]|nr:hypothetical protein [Bryobacteraceae bacterium]